MSLRAAFSGSPGRSRGGRQCISSLVIYGIGECPRQSLGGQGGNCRGSLCGWSNASRLATEMLPALQEHRNRSDCIAAIAIGQRPKRMMPVRTNVSAMAYPDSASHPKLGREAFRVGLRGMPGGGYIIPGTPSLFFKEASSDLRTALNKLGPIEGRIAQRISVAVWLAAQIRDYSASKTVGPSEQPADTFLESVRGVELARHRMRCKIK
ncbi:hypothetical protein ACVW1B_003343 [Bradyrhizobium sp. USDA 4502]